MINFIKPDWKKCNLNISATLAEYLGAPNKNETLPVLKECLAKSYKNIVFICFDGLGIHPMSVNLSDDDFLRRNIRQKLYSTFPATTTNATTSLLYNQLPREHGWFGWSMNFERLNKNIDIFLNRDSYTGEKVEIKESPIGEKNYYFDNANSSYSINTVFPPYVYVKYPDRNHVSNNMDEFFENIKKICNKDGKQFVYAYFDDPDATMHQKGVSSVEAKEIISKLSQKTEELYSSLGDSTIIIITADHGHIDINGYVELYKDEKLMDMLTIYPYMESRAVAFKVKENKEKEFEDYFNKKYGVDFQLHKSSELIEDNYFGESGDKSSLLGNYIAIGTDTYKQALLTPNYPKFKGHHTSLTDKEMEVPLIILEK